MVYIGNLAHLIDVLIEQKKSGVFIASDNAPLSTTKLIQLIANKLDKKTYLLHIPLFERLLKLIKPDFYKRLYMRLEVDNSKTVDVLGLNNPYETENGIKNMIYGEK